MLITEICKRYYFSMNPKQKFVTRLELCGSRIVSVSPFIRNLYILAGKEIDFLINISLFIRFSNISLWLSCNMDFNGNRKKYCWRIKTTFFSRMSTELQLFNSYILKSI